MTTGDVARKSPLSGAQVAAALAAILMATSVLPLAAAWLLNETRIAQTRTRVLRAGEELRANFSLVIASGVSGVACGPGRPPDLVLPVVNARAAAAALATHDAWLRGARRAPEWFGPRMPADAWGRCLLLNLGEGSADGPVWLLSAGPNGVVETPPDASAPVGDDIGDRIR